MVSWKEVHVTQVSDRSKLQRLVYTALSHLLPKKKKVRHIFMHMYVCWWGRTLYVIAYALEGLGRIHAKLLTVATTKE